MKVIEWISYEAAKEMSYSIDAMGGWVDGEKWDQYLVRWPEEALPYLEALRKAILEGIIKFGGDQHQYSEDGVPVFSDKTVALFSYRGWGDLMAAIWNTAENGNYSYMDFYMR